MFNAALTVSLLLLLVIPLVAPLAGSAPTPAERMSRRVARGERKALRRRGREAARRAPGYRRCCCTCHPVGGMTRLSHSGKVVHIASTTPIPEESAR